MNTLGHAVGEREGWGLVGIVGGLPSIGWRGEYFTFLGSFCAATHIIDKACSIAVIKTNQCHLEGEKNISHAISL